MTGRKMPHGAAQAVGLLLAAIAPSNPPDCTTLNDVRNCADCDGPVTRCPHCGHWHCDEPGCMPVECARAEDE
jgi:hypothetical protein